MTERTAANCGAVEAERDALVASFGNLTLRGIVGGTLEPRERLFLEAITKPRARDQGAGDA